MRKKRGASSAHARWQGASASAGAARANAERISLKPRITGSPARHARGVRDFQRERQCEAEHCAAAGIVGDLQFLAMRFDDEAADREADAHAGGFRRDEWLEQLLAQRRRQARPGIGDADLKLLRRE